MKSAISPAGPKPKSRFTSPPDPGTAGSWPIETHALARALIGATLERRFPDGRLAGGRIVETEAYPPGDPASHAFRGETPRTRVMFGPPLRAYVYFIYGSAWCFNVTSEPIGIGAAVLIRALEPLAGLDLMRERRPRATRDRDLARGPGRLCAALGIDGTFTGAALEGTGELRIRPAHIDAACGVSVRIGLTKAADAPYRYYLRGSDALSGPRALSPAEDVAGSKRSMV